MNVQLRSQGLFDEVLRINSCGELIRVHVLLIKKGKVTPGKITVIGSKPRPPPCR